MRDAKLGRCAVTFAASCVLGLGALAVSGAVVAEAAGAVGAVGQDVVAQMEVMTASVPSAELFQLDFAWN